MSKRFFAISAFLIVALAPGSAFAWGFAAHKLIMRRAIELLPPELKPFFDQNKEEVVVRVVDPDLWRNVGWDEDPNHFVDFGVPDTGSIHSRSFLRQYSAALEKFGAATLRRNGMLPWRAAEQFGNLRRTFEELPRNAPYTLSNLVLFTPIASHYVQDAYQPFHATDNHDGAETGNLGIHARFERDLMERFEARLRLTPAAPQPIADVRTAAFDALLASYQLTHQILQADTESIAGRDRYDDEYFEKFFVKVQPILERRLSEAITATAGTIMGAWNQAGRPALRLRDARPVQRVRPRP